MQDHELGALPNISIEDAKFMRAILELGRPASLSDRLSNIEDLDLATGSPRTVTKLRSSHPSALWRVQKLLALPTKTSTRIPNSPVATASLLGEIKVFSAYFSI